MCGIIRIGIKIGAGGRNRTDIGLPLRDFESRASTCFTTPAKILFKLFKLLERLEP